MKTIFEFDNDDVADRLALKNYQNIDAILTNIQHIERAHQRFSHWLDTAVDSGNADDYHIDEIRQQFLDEFEGLL